MTVLCPSVIDHFQRNLKRREIVDEGYHEGEQFTGARSKTKIPFPVDRGKQIAGFKYYYKCKNCGFERTETKRIGFDSPVG
jgi:hypothetical protein